jgi:hypothetical protein
MAAAGRTFRAVRRAGTGLRAGAYAQGSQVNHYKHVEEFYRKRMLRVNYEIDDLSGGFQ